MADQSIVTKSGTNQLHGSGYEFYRGDQFNQKNFFAPTKPDYERNQFGATGGGSVMRNSSSCSAPTKGCEPSRGSRFWGACRAGLSLGDFSALATPIRDPLTGQPFLAT